VVAAVGTTGAAPMLASLLRNDIEARVPPGAGRVAVLLRQMQGEVRTAYPDLVARRAFLRSVLSGEAADAAMAGDMVRAEGLLRAQIDRGGSPVGRLAFVAGRGPGDLLTLRASRALAEADVISADPDADPSVLALARRDAGRLTPEESEPKALAALVRAGRQVVRIITKAPEVSTLRALAAEDVIVEVMLAAPGT
jgi:precorrin-2 dehydrogenase/sirohydrochlorin ferrochelatase